MSTPTSEHPLVPLTPPAVTPEKRRRRSPLSVLGLVVSVLSLAGVVWWASKQQAPQLPHTAAEITALIGAIALYALATVVRSERWQRLLVDEQATPRRSDTYALTVVGYMGNNVLPARAGDAIRVVLMAPLAKTSNRTVVGTLLAERLLDVAVLLVLFVVVGYGLLGEVGGSSVELIVGIVAAAAIAAVFGWRLVRRNERMHAMIAPIASATLGLRRAHHGLLLLAMTLLIWSIEAGVWMSVGAAVGFDMDPIEGLYLVALASVFSMIPSGPAYAGTQDTAVAIGIKAIGGTGATAVSYLLMLRFVIVVPITIAGLILMVIRYGGLAKLRSVRAEAKN
ncbi:MAG TPA: lysylphosphatidylglycerol synthase transmembrane domain-containing protein [Solirubrobacter sp.]|nr:lysylphosphatidylglycerol synthase transmembrane domain-containing protein [Solirubrobacter sp.]